MSVNLCQSEARKVKSSPAPKDKELVHVIGYLVLCLKRVQFDWLPVQVVEGVLREQSRRVGLTAR